MPAVNRQEPDIHPAVSSRAVHLPDGNDFGTGTFTTALAPNALTATETIESLIMLPPDSEVAIHVNPVKWQGASLLVAAQRRQNVPVAGHARGHCVE